jgi:predicted metal-dependent HD superfamily phosphohydrolase
MDVVSVDALTCAVLDAGWPRPATLALVASVAEAYGSPPRAYHNLRHLEELLGWYAAVRAQGPGWRAPHDVLCALLYHDAIYVAGRADNEARSADLAVEHIARFGLPCDAARVSALIRATARHGGEPIDEAHDPDLAHFLDADMAILGAPLARFDAYESAIATEYGALPQDAFRAGRGRFLARLLALPRLYQTSFFRSRLESVARANLARASAALND